MVNIPVTVMTEWTGPAGFAVNITAQPIEGSTMNYTSTAVVDSLGRNESGVYTCMATIITTSPFLRDSASNNGTARITVGKTVGWPHSQAPSINFVGKHNTIAVAL